MSQECGELVPGGGSVILRLTVSQVESRKSKLLCVRLIARGLKISSWGLSHLPLPPKS